MDNTSFEAVRVKLESLTPGLTNEVVAAMESNPKLKERFGARLFEVANQATVAFRDILLSATEFEHPQILTIEMNWLDKLLEARQLDRATTEQFLTIFRHRVATELPPEQAAPLLQTMDEAMQQLKNK